MSRSQALNLMFMNQSGAQFQLVAGVLIGNIKQLDPAAEHIAPGCDGTPRTIAYKAY